MERLWLLAVPAVVAVAAMRTNLLPFKMAVPLLCAAALLFFSAPGAAATLPANQALVVTAFALSAAGDFFLSRKEGRPGYFVTGIGLYFAVHLCYLGFSLSNGTPSLPVLAVALGASLWYYLWILRPAIPDRALSAAVLIYLLVSCAALGAAAGLGWTRLPGALFVAGIALIVVSDTAISLVEFLHARGAAWLILPTYYLALLAITAALL